jgi:hypothetical protein
MVAEIVEDYVQFVRVGNPGNYGADITGMLLYVSGRFQVADKAT